MLMKIEPVVMASSLHSWLRDPKPLCYEEHLYCLPPFFFQNFVQPRSSCCHIFLAECVITPHMMCYFALWYYGPKIFKLFGNVVRAVQGCVFHATNHQIHGRFETHGMVFGSSLIWCHRRRTHGDTQGPLDWHKLVNLC